MRGCASTATGVVAAGVGRRRGRADAAAGLAVAACLLGGAALAEEAEPATPTEPAATEAPAAADPVVALDPITVRMLSPIGPDATYVAEDTETGTKTDTPILEIPQSVSVVTEEQMVDQNPQNLEDTLRYTAGVFSDGWGSDERYQVYQIRGFEQTTLGTYRDGMSDRVSAWFTTSRFEPYGLQRVEILKGSTSTLYGLNSPGGLVNMVTKRPTTEDIREIVVQGGSWYNRQAAFDVGGAVDKEGVWSYRLTGLTRISSTQIDHTQDNRAYIAPAVTWRPNEDTSFTVLANYLRTESSPPTGVPQKGSLDPNPYGRLSRSTFVGEPDYNHFDTDQYSISTFFEHNLNDSWQIRQNMRFTDVELDYETVYANALKANDRTLTRSSFAVDGSAQRFVVDSQAEHTLDLDGIDNKMLFGLEYSYDRGDEDIQYGTARSIDVYDIHYFGRKGIHPEPYVDWVVTQNTLGAYVQDQLTIADRWVLTAGGRYDYVDTVADDKVSQSHDATTDNAFTGRLGLNYLFDNGVAPYVSYSTSFQPLVAPTLNGYAARGTLKPTTGEQYEIGIKYKPTSFDALFTLAAFDLTQNNVLTPGPNPAYQVQVGQVNVKGVEFEAKVALTGGLSLTAAYTYLHPEITKANDGTKGNEPYMVPNHMASLWATYAFSEGSGLGGLTVGGGVRYISEIWGDTANTVRIPGYVLYDAMARYEIDEHWDLQVNATNLLDKEYVSTCYYGSCYYGDARRVLASLKYKW